MGGSIGSLRDTTKRQLQIRDRINQSIGQLGNKRVIITQMVWFKKSLFPTCQVYCVFPHEIPIVIFFPHTNVSPTVQQGCGLSTCCQTWTKAVSDNTWATGWLHPERGRTLLESSISTVSVMARPPGCPFNSICSLFQSTVWHPVRSHSGGAACFVQFRTDCLFSWQGMITWILSRKVRVDLFSWIYFFNMLLLEF